MNERIGGVAALLLALVWLGGCQTAEPGVVMNFGTLQTRMDVPPPAIIEAARSALDDMRFADVVAASTALDGRVTARTARDEAVVIEAVVDQPKPDPHAKRTRVDPVVQETPEAPEVQEQTVVTIHVGRFGDKVVSLKILDAIEQRLADER